MVVNVCTSRSLPVQVSTLDQPMVFTCSDCIATAACLVMQKKKKKKFEAQRCLYIGSQLGKSFQQLNHFLLYQPLSDRFKPSMFQCHHFSHLLEETDCQIIK